MKTFEQICPQEGHPDFLNPLMFQLCGCYSNTYLTVSALLLTTIKNVIFKSKHVLDLMYFCVLFVMLSFVCSGVLVEIACVGTSEGEIIEVLSQHFNSQRYEISEYYKQSFGQVCYSKVLTALILYNIGTDEAEIIEVLKSHSLRQRLEIKDYYKQSFGKVCNRPLPGADPGFGQGGGPSF